jgi:hypothetical protein
MYSYKNKIYNPRLFILNKKLPIRKRAASDIAFIINLVHLIDMHILL